MEILLVCTKGEGLFTKGEELCSVSLHHEEGGRENSVKEGSLESFW